jgi:hypothetical protein
MGALVAPTSMALACPWRSRPQHQKSKYAKQNIVEDLRQRSVDIYLAAETREAKTDSKKFDEAADEIARLRAETRVLFWLIIAMNTAVISIFIIAYRFF